MKAVKFVEIHAEVLNMLRKNGIKPGYVELTGMYRDYKALRSVPGSKHTEALREVCGKYGLGHTKAWEVITALDKDL
ncbi:MAG: hypothetical protein J6Y33_03530 [Prevotella sp.]|nr:hypothetical protein [Prevotella sp.]